MTALSVQNISVSLGGKTVLDRVGFDAGPGEFIGLIGPNGAGKTTLLKAMLGLVRADGAVLLDGRAIGSLNARDRARAIAYLPQERDVAWPVSSHMLVSLGRSALKPSFASLDAGDEALIRSAMQRMDVEAFGERPANALSGGELARVLIARVLAQDTPVILADEPVAGLDPSHQLALMENFAALAHEGRTVIASLHELSLAAQYCTRLIILDNGRLAADGPPQDVLTPERLRQIYGIEAHILHLDGQFIVQPKSRA